MDILDLNWQTTGANRQVPQIRISARFVDSQTQQTTIGDYRQSVGKSILFPDVVSSLTAGERQDLMQAIVDALIVIYRKRHEE